MRIVSLLPSATEMVFALGIGDQLVGVTHECDFPPEVRQKPVVVRSAIDTNPSDPEQIDRTVNKTLESGRSLYTVDEALLKELNPDLVLTQDLCQVCAPSGNEIGQMLDLFPNPPRVLWMTPKSISDIFQNILTLGEAVGRRDTAENLLTRLRGRVKAVSDRNANLKGLPRVFCMEWLAPPFAAGHWMAEVVEIAGGSDNLARRGQDSIRLPWETIREYAPEVLILCPCGFSLPEVIGQADLLSSYPGWDQLPAVKNGRVYAVDANSYFARPGPRIIDGIELLAHLIHPDRFSWNGPADAYRSLNYNELKNQKAKET